MIFFAQKKSRGTSCDGTITDDQRVAVVDRVRIIRA
jgi:hypothetical protein